MISRRPENRETCNNDALKRFMLNSGPPLSGIKSKKKSEPFQVKLFLPEQLIESFGYE